MYHRNMRPERILGQYFTPELVVELCYRILHSLDPHAHSPIIIDPACGEGAFLRYAVENKITSSQRLLGVEKDPFVAAFWEESGLSKKARLFVQDGLVAPVAGTRQADWVVGNPPYGTQNLRADADSMEFIKIIGERFTILQDRPGQTGLSAYPVEILFLERFFQLARPGGYAALVVPDGILANARLTYVREWLTSRADILSIISLPQHTFQRSGASSKASVLVFRRPATPCSTRPSPPIFMASLESSRRLDLSVARLVMAFEESIHLGLESAVDCGAWLAFQVNAITPGSRLDPAYYHPKFARNSRTLDGLPDVRYLGELIEYTTYGRVGRRELSASGIPYLTPSNLLIRGGYTIGISASSRFVLPGSLNDPSRSRVHAGDILFANSGVGCIGRSAVYYGDQPCNISQHINLIRLRDVEPGYAALYLQTQFARLQIEREKCGVGACGINFGRIKSIRISMLSPSERNEFGKQYRVLVGDSCCNGSAMGKLVHRLEERILGGVEKAATNASDASAAE